MVKRTTEVRRISKELDIKLGELAKKNDMDRVKASREMAKAFDKLKGRKMVKRRQIIDEIRF